MAGQVERKQRAFVQLEPEFVRQRARLALRPREQSVEDAPLAKELELVSERPAVQQRVLLQGLVLAGPRVRLAAQPFWRRPELELPEERAARERLQARWEEPRDDDERHGKLLPWPAFPPVLRIPRRRQCRLVPEWRGEP